MSITGYIQIARPDHWFKHIFMAPGVVLALFFDSGSATRGIWGRLVLGIAAACLVASANYVLNEILDASRDRFHPGKKARPIPSGQVRLGAAWIQWLVLSAIGLGAGFAHSATFGAMTALLWVMAAMYNVPPVRLKDAAYADVLCESVNNPLRMAMGWYATGTALVPPVSALGAYWMFGAFLMAAKRLGEFRRIGDAAIAARYRSSFGFYTEHRLIESIFFYASLFGMLSGVFIARYHVELVLATPLVAYTMAYYLHLAFKPDSPVQYPELLYRQQKLALLCVLTFAACVALLFARIPALDRMLKPTPVRSGPAH